MSTTPVSPFVAVGDADAAACEGDFCAVPEVQERVTAPEDQPQALSPDDRAPTPHPGS